MLDVLAAASDSDLNLFFIIVSFPVLHLTSPSLTQPVEVTVPVPFIDVKFPLRVLNCTHSLNRDQDRDPVILSESDPRRWCSTGIGPESSRMASVGVLSTRVMKMPVDGQVARWTELV